MRQAYDYWQDQPGNYHLFFIFLYTLKEDESTCNNKKKKKKDSELPKKLTVLLWYDEINSNKRLFRPSIIDDMSIKENSKKKKRKYTFTYTFLLFR